MLRERLSPLLEFQKSSSNTSSDTSQPVNSSAVVNNPNSIDPPQPENKAKPKRTNIGKYYSRNDC